MRQKRQCFVAVTHSKIADSKVADCASQRDGGSKAPQWNLEDSCGEYKNLEGCWRGKERRHQHPKESVVLHPLTDGSGPLSGFLLEESFPAFPCDEVQNHTAENGANACHEGVKRHAQRVLYGKFDEQEVVDDRKTEDGGIEKRNQKQAGSA